MRCSVDPARQTAHHRETGARQTCRQPLGLCEAVSRRVTRTDDRNGQLVLWLVLAPTKQYARRIMNLSQQPWVIATDFGQYVDAMFSRELQLGFGIDLFVRG